MHFVGLFFVFIIENARSKRQKSRLGPYGETRINDNEERLIDLCESHNLRITNGYFKHKMIHKYTWEQHTQNLKSIIDYIIVKQKSKF